MQYHPLTPLVSMHQLAAPRVSGYAAALPAPQLSILRGIKKYQ
jgi:hypothetical protein